jgi:hypothetical protein
MKIQQSVQKLLVGDTQTDRQTGDMISLTSFLESRLKTKEKKGKKGGIEKGKENREVSKGWEG